MSLPAIQRIAVGTDGSDTARRAVDVALDLAERFGSELLVATSYRPVGESRLRAEREDAPAEVRWSINAAEDADAPLREAEGRAKERGIPVTSEARTGDPVRVLCDVVDEYGVDILVVGNKGMHRKHLRSVPNSVSHDAACSVLIVKTV